MREEIRCGALTFVGYDKKDNGKWIIEQKGDWFYVIFQHHEFAQKICGYVVRQADGSFKAFDLMETYKQTFEKLSDAVTYTKTKYYEKEKRKGGI